MPETFQFDRTTRRYRSATTGRFLAERAVADDLGAYITLTGSRMEVLTASLRAGSLDLVTWEDRMMAEIKAVHLNAVILAHGGRAQMAPADYGLAGRLIRQQYDFLRAWSGQIAGGQAPVDGRMVTRARLYAQSANGTSATVRARDMREAGFQMERNRLMPGENCDGCVTEDARGWVPIGTLVAVGHRVPCRVNCRCRLAYRDGQVSA